jgi:hypothetical protein
MAPSGGRCRLGSAEQEVDRLTDGESLADALHRSANRMSIAIGASNPNVDARPRSAGRVAGS